MSDTPRTDEVARINEKPNSLQYCEEYVPADFARQLERELGKVRGDCEAWNKAYHEEKKRADQLERDLAAVTKKWPAC